MSARPWERWAFIGAGFTVTLGFFPSRLGLGALLSQYDQPRALWGILFQSVALMIVVLTFFPMALALLGAARGMRLSPFNSKLLAAYALAFGGGGTVFFATLAGGSQLVLLEGFALTLACAGSLLALHLGGAVRPAVCALLLPPVVVAVISLLGVPRLVWAAEDIAGDSSYCIAHHFENSAVESYADLRWLSFYTMLSGYEVNQNWQFHGVMIVEREIGMEFYNWSPRKLEFDFVGYEERLFIPVRFSCMPETEFASTLRIY